MKKVLTLIAASCVAVLCAASPVTLQRAREMAGKHFGTEPSRPRLVMGSKATVSVSSVSDAPYYIFNNADGKGFIIIAGDDCLEPVLAYSPDRPLDENHMAPALKAWLEGISADVQYIRKEGIKQTDEIAAKWAEAPSTRAADDNKVVLDVANWSQENPYNWYCPIITQYESERSVTGCVATAISMIMHYHQWPPCGKGTLPDYDMIYWTSNYSYVTVPMSGHALGHEYKWDMMPFEDFADESNLNPTEGQKQVAWLMWDCGIMMQAQYSYEGTGAYSQDIPARMRRYMYYSSSQYVERSSYSDDEWLELMRDQIDRDLPVIYGAETADDEGHQFIVCGYDFSSSTKKLYVNWGWGGYGNAFFALSRFRPTGYPTFSKGHDAIINLEPDKTTVPTPVDTPYPDEGVDPPPVIDPTDAMYLHEGVQGTRTYYGISVSSGTLAYGSSFKLNVGFIHNDGTSSYDGYFKVDQVDYQGNYIGTVGSRSSIATLSAGSKWVMRDLSCTAANEFTLGDKLALFTSPSQEGEYFQIHRLDDDTATIDELYLVPMYFISTADGQKLTNSNEPYQSVSWTTESDSVKAVITYADGTTETIIQEQ